MSSKKVKSSDQERERQERKEKQFINELLGIKYQTNIDMIQKAKMINDKINEKRKDLHKIKHKLLEKDIIGESRNNLPMIELGKYKISNNFNLGIIQNNKIKNSKNLVLSTNAYNSNRVTANSNINFIKVNKFSSNTSLVPSRMNSIYGGERDKETIKNYSNNDTINSYSIKGNNFNNGHNSNNNNKFNYYNNSTIHTNGNSSPDGNNLTPSLHSINLNSNFNITPYLKNLQERTNMKRALLRKVYTRSMAFSNQCIYPHNSTHIKVDCNNCNRCTIDSNNITHIYDNVNRLGHYNPLSNKILNSNFDGKSPGLVNQVDSSLNNNSIHNYICKRTLSTIYTNGGSNENTNYVPREYNRGRLKEREKNNTNNYSHSNNNTNAEHIIIQNTYINESSTNNNLQNKIRSNLAKILHKEILSAGRNNNSRSVFGSKSKSPRDINGLNHSLSDSNTSVNSIINNFQYSFMNTKSSVNTNQQNPNILSNPNIISTTSRKSKRNNNSNNPIKKGRNLNNLNFDILQHTPSGSFTPGNNNGNMNLIKSKINHLNMNVNVNQGQIPVLFPNIKKVEGV
jgi:hypothetical protein